MKTLLGILLIAMFSVSLLVGCTEPLKCDEDLDCPFDCNGTSGMRQKCVDGTCQTIGLQYYCLLGCGASCETDSDCSEGHYCDIASCSCEERHFPEECETDADCSQGYHCSSQKRCAIMGTEDLSECEEDNDCVSILSRACCCINDRYFCLNRKHVGVYQENRELECESVNCPAIACLPLEPIDCACQNKVCVQKTPCSTDSVDACDRICSSDEDCKHTCGCGCVSKDEECDEKGIIFDCVEMGCECKNGVCAEGEELIGDAWVAKNLTQCAEEWHSEGWAGNKTFETFEEMIIFFYEREHVMVYEVEREPIDIEAVCEACECLSGLKIYLRVPKSQLSKVLKLGYAESAEPTKPVDCVTNWDCYAVCASTECEEHCVPARSCSDGICDCNCSIC